MGTQTGARLARDRLHFRSVLNSFGCPAYSNNLNPNEGVSQLSEDYKDRTRTDPNPNEGAFQLSEEPPNHKEYSEHTENKAYPWQAIERRAAPGPSPLAQSQRAGVAHAGLTLNP